jgi:hypothetical protein
MMVRSAGVEPTTLGFGNQYSIQLSYERFETARSIAFFAGCEASLRKTICQSLTRRMSLKVLSYSA